jgi:single-strand DNA-binding protein
MNIVLLRGVLSSPPVVRTLPSGSELCAYEVTTPAEDGPACSVPVAWFDPPARRTALLAGDEVVVVGHVRRRFFRSGGVTTSRTEVVAHGVVPARHRRRAERLVAAAVAGVE